MSTEYKIDVPISDVSVREEAGADMQMAQGVDAPKQLQNFAGDETTKQFILANVVPMITEVKARRKGLEEEWHAIRRMDVLVHDEGKKYNGRSNAYVPVFSRTLNTVVSALSKGLFPSDDYMDVYDRGAGDTEKARALKAYMQYEFESVARLRTKIKPFLRQFAAFGNAVLKFGYNKDLRMVGRTRVFGADGMLPTFEKEDYCEGLTVSARNIFNFYVYPETAEDLASAILVAEDVDVPRSYMLHMKEKRRWLNVDEGINQPNSVMADNIRSRVLADTADLATANMFATNEVAAVQTLTEVYTLMKLPRSAYFEDEIPGAPIPVRIVLAGTVPMVIERNQFFHQSPPYLVARQMVTAGSFYGQGVGRLVRHLQYLTNDFTNQANDVGIYALNPIQVVNPAYIAGPLPPIKPGVVWKTTDIQQGIKFERPPVDIVNIGSQLMGQYIGMVQDFGGAPSVLQGTGAGKAAKTATGAQILQRNALSPLQDLVEDIENDVLVPLMRGTWRNAMQFRERPVMLRVMGAPIQITPEDLAIDAEFRWIASSQSANKQVQTQNMIQFMQSLLPIMPLLQANGYMVNPEPILRRVFNDGFGFRGFDQVVFKMPQQPMAPGMPGAPVDPAMAGGVPGGMPQGMPPGTPGQGGVGVGPSDADRIRSALEQLTGEPVEAVPGEGEDFMEVRAQADELAALQSKLGG